MLHLHQLLLLKDNYGYLLHDDESGETAVIDPSEAQPVLDVLQLKGWQLDYILNTHHHGDHTGGNLELKRYTGAEVIGYESDAKRLPGFDRGVEEGDEIRLGDVRLQVLFIPGHTLGHIAFYAEKQGWLFCGDTLFSLGCGRLFEGTAEQIYQSLKKLAALPPKTKVYCGHEYTQRNADFALEVDGTNQALLARVEEVNHLCREGKATVPSTIAQENATNPFLRTQSAAAFAELRRRKDMF